MGEILEVIMLLCFGFAWPASLIKSYRSRTAKGKSLMFLIVVLLGYLAGVLSKFALGRVNYVVFFYFLNFFMVFCDLLLYFRNTRLDAARAKAGPEENPTL